MILRTPFKTLRNAECAVHNAEWSAGNSLPALRSAGQAGAFRTPNSELPEVLKPALRRWFVLIAILLALGSVRVTQQTMLWLKAYELGRMCAELHALENETLWLKAKVVALRSPAHLAKAKQAQRLDLVAWSTLPAAPKVVQLASASLASY